MPPPGLAPAPTRRNHVNGSHDTMVGAALISHYVAIAKADPALADVRASRLGRLVRRFIATGQPERDLVSYVVGYSDPTGEAAVRHVLRERGW